MMAKIVKGRGFKGAVNYILDSDKQTRLIGADGVRLKDISSVVHSFVTQAGMNPRVSKPVCHISLSFSAQDKEKVTDVVMSKIAHEYMHRMGIKETQYIVARHHDKEHPHCHIIFNRINNNGKTISDSNDRFRSEKICKELTHKYGLYFALGKENVKVHRLKEPDKTKYEIYNVLKDTVPRCRNWDKLNRELSKSGISTKIKYKGSTNEPEGVKFCKNGYYFNGSQVDRQFSYSKIDYQLKQNVEAQEVKIPLQTHSPVSTAIGSVLDAAGSILSGMSDIQPSNTNYDENEAEYWRLRRKKKKKKGITR